MLVLDSVTCETRDSREGQRKKDDCPFQPAMFACLPSWPCNTISVEVTNGQGPAITRTGLPWLPSSPTLSCILGLWSWRPAVFWCPTTLAYCIPFNRFMVPLSGNVYPKFLAFSRQAKLFDTSKHSRVTLSVSSNMSASHCFGTLHPCPLFHGPF